MSICLLLSLLCVQFSVAIRTPTRMCPTNCSCTPFGTELTVDCHQRSDIIHEQLSAQLDSLLSGNLTYGRLTRLWIVNTPLTQVPRSVCQLTTLTVLHLSNSRLTRLPDSCIANLSNLVEFKAQHNSIETLQDGVFDGLTKLRYLNLSGNRIRSIGLSVFATASNLSSLFYIDLSENKLTSLEPWIYDRGIIGSFGRRVRIYLTDNSISKFTNRMGFSVELCNKKKPFASVYLRNNDIRHIRDILDGWQLDILKAFNCYRVDDGVLNLLLWIDGNKIACDCINFPFFKVVALQYLPKTWRATHCNLTDPLKGRSSIVNGFDLDHRDFVCELTERCPAGCICVHRPANSTLHVYCSNANLTVLPLLLPQLPDTSTKYKLDFSNNPFLRRLERRDYFLNTTILDVSNSGVVGPSLADWKGIANIPEVNLFGNKITSLPLSILSINFTVRELNLADNPWDCSCDSKWMSDWFSSFQDDRLAQKVMCYSPSRLRGKNIIQISREEFCVDPASEASSKAVKTTLTISLSSVAGVVVVLLFVGVLVYRLRVKLYTRWNFHPFDRDECLGENMDFDVFLSSSSTDNLPHGNEIREKIEQRGYRVCYPPRDFLVGEAISDNIYNAIVRSKRTVCLLTEHFTQSAYCMHEFQVAFHHNIIVKRKKRLIVLMALNRPKELFADDASDTAVLRQYVRQYTYIDYTTDGWLDKLLYALPVRGLNQPELRSATSSS